MTAAQERVYRIILEAFRDTGRAPTIREITDAAGFASPNATRDHLEPLARHGLIVLSGDHTARGIQVPAIRDAAKAAATLLINPNGGQK